MENENKKVETQPDREINFEIAAELIEKLEQNFKVEDRANFYGLEVVNEEGNVELISAGKWDETPVRTTLYSIPLAEYADNRGRHTVSLYARKNVHGAWGNIPLVSVFVVDQATGEDGKKSLVGMPGLLYRREDATIGRYQGEGIWNQSQAINEHAQRSELSVAVMESLGVDGLEQLVDSSQREQDVSELQARLIEALQAREESRTSVEPFSDLAWRTKGYSTPEGRGLEASREEQYQKAEEEQQAKSGLGKLVARLTARLKR